MTGKSLTLLELRYVMTLLLWKFDLAIERGLEMR